MTGAVIGEFIASSRGLGYLVYSASNEMNMAVAFAALVVLVSRRRRRFRAGTRGTRIALATSDEFDHPLWNAPALKHIFHWKIHHGLIPNRQRLYRASLTSDFIQ